MRALRRAGRPPSDQPAARHRCARRPGARCAEAGFKPRVAFEAGTPLPLARFAARGLGVAVLPELTEAQAAATGVRALPLTDPGARARVALARCAAGPSSPAARALLERLRAALVPNAAP
ncbi:LysR family transcriptional regulator substrate-binding protein [Streptomyces sp. NPDC050264]|uniref:LysR family transcriptional regulator substrate-binding protein n=1 Tax=Streptomyces sp. NPDC050264 TaxID=3155038 RepID=UPI00344A8661